MNEHIEITDTKENAVHKRSPEKIIAVIGAAVLLVKALLCTFLLWSGAYIRYVERYDFYPRNMNWSMSMQEVLKRENVEFNRLERDWGILLESKEDVEFYGYDAKLIYAFVDDKLMSGYFYIYNDSPEEKEQAEDYIEKRLRLHHHNKIDALFGPYPVYINDGRETQMGVSQGYLGRVENPDPFWKENVSVVFFESDAWQSWVISNYEFIN